MCVSMPMLRVGVASVKVQWISSGDRKRGIPFSNEFTSSAVRARACVAASGVCVVRARLMAKTPMPLPKLGLNSTSSFSRSWSLPVAATVADHIASVALARSAVTVAVPGRTFISGGSFILQAKFGVNQRTSSTSYDVGRLVVGSFS